MAERTGSGKRLHLAFIFGIPATTRRAGQDRDLLFDDRPRGPPDEPRRVSATVAAAVTATTPAPTAAAVFGFARAASASRCALSNRKDEPLLCPDFGSATAWGMADFGMLDMGTLQSG